MILIIINIMIMTNIIMSILAISKGIENGYWMFYSEQLF